jgi:hypothetical protein
MNLVVDRDSARALGGAAARENCLDNFLFWWLINCTGLKCRMNARFKPMPKRSISLVMLCSLLMLACSGCATYFRTGEWGFEEIKERNADLERNQHLFLQPGTLSGSWRL